MNEKKNKYEKRLQFQQKVISNKSERIELLELEIEKLKFELDAKDKIINSVAPLKNELTKNVEEINKYKKEYAKLIQELKKMKEIANQTMYKGRWRFVKFLIK